MSTKPIIAVDIDDVLAASAQGWVAYSNQKWGTNLEVDDYIEDWATMWQVDHAVMMERAHEIYGSGLVATFDHDAEALAVLKHLSKDYTLVIATSRVRHVHHETLAWLERHFKGVFNDIHLAGIYDSNHTNPTSLTKADLIQTIGADYLIDDQLKHCEAVAKDGVKAVLFGNYAWNQAKQLKPGIVRCANWQAVGAYFDGQH